MILDFIKLSQVKNQEIILINHSQKINACKIDKQVLDKMPTAKLIDMVLEYPILIDIFSYDSLQTGFEIVSTYCDPLVELKERNDAGTYLLDTYKNEDVSSAFKNINSVTENNNFLKMCVTEILLAQPEINEDFSVSEKLELDKEINKKNQEKGNDERFGLSKNIYYQVELTTSSNFVGSSFSSKIASISTAAATQITYSVSLLPVLTPNGTYIYPLRADNDYTSTEKTALNNQYISAYPNATYISTSTAKYNCHSYAWHSTSPDNISWINDPSPYWSDGSYTYVGTSPTANGQKVYYDRSGTEHSGIVTDYSNKKITSKWGQGPVMLHNEKDCPYYVAAWSVLPVIKYYKR